MKKKKKEKEKEEKKKFEKRAVKDYKINQMEKEKNINIITIN